jgi:hypothetical protein
VTSFSEKFFARAEAEELHPIIDTVVARFEADLNDEQQVHGHRAAATGIVIVNNDGFVRWSAGLHPHVTLGGWLSIGLLEHLHHGCIDVEERTIEQLVAAITQRASVWSGTVTPERQSTLPKRVCDKPSTNLTVNSLARKAALALLLGSGCGGNGDVTGA